MLEFLWPASAKHGTAMDEQVNNFTAYAHASSAITHAPAINNLKRKREDSGPTSVLSMQLPPQRGRECIGHVEVQDAPTGPVVEQGKNAALSPPQDSFQAESLIDAPIEGARSFASVPSNAPSKPLLPDRGNDGHTEKASHPRQDTTMSLDMVKSKIEAEFNMEILLKHREVRLIDQELAKCQISLEQLSRCSVIPYPAHSGKYEDMAAVSDGFGPSYNNAAAHAPPWGVEDGPYTRHLQRWLLTSSTFDESTLEVPATPSTSRERISDRPTRGLKSEQGFATTQSRSQRGSASHLKALPHGYPEPKEEKGPMIERRKSDGHMVKLVCLDCRRSNFNSTQGFINHCRIAHARQFASHDAAIEASGEEVDAESAQGVPAEASVTQGTASACLLHPMIRAARPPALDLWKTSKSSKERKASVEMSTSSPHAAHDPVVSTPSYTPNGNFTSPPFKPSPHTPHLSAMLAKIGTGGDLHDMVTDAKSRDEIELLQESDSEGSSTDEDEDEAPQSRSTRGVVQSSVRPASSTTPPSTLRQDVKVEVPSDDYPAYQPLPAVHTPVSAGPYGVQLSDQDNQDSPMVGASTPYNLSPNTTDPHPAPSLVSDDGDCDNIHSESETSSHTDIEDDEDHYVHTGLLHHEDLDLADGSGIALSHPEKAHRPTAGSRSIRRTPLHGSDHEERHVSFASPARPREPSEVAN